MIDVQERLTGRRTAGETCLLRNPLTTLNVQVVLPIIMFATLIGVRLENGIYGHSRFCNTNFDDIQEKSLPFTKPVF